ncbi:hypothetical protein Sjap_021976 [Stephania japonica]|uniref:Protein kinase domain-containing protein n=1 Tax=Stephania japonica TaxID=461633 RepID=A0AAP0HSB7_9MAGN
MMPVTPVIRAMSANLSAIRDVCHVRYPRIVRHQAQFVMSVIHVSCNIVADLSVPPAYLRILSVITCIRSSRSGKGLTMFIRIKILRDCALALQFLHSHPDGGIVHEAIKLSNILLNNNMEVKNAGFQGSTNNLAVILQVLTGRGVVNLNFHALDQLIQMAKVVIVMGK